MTAGDMSAEAVEDVARILFDQRQTGMDFDDARDGDAETDGGCLYSICCDDARAVLRALSATPEPAGDVVEAAIHLVYRIEAAGTLDCEAGNFERWKATARKIAPSLRALRSHQPRLSDGVAEAVAAERERLAYKTGHNEGYIDATDDGTGNGYPDHDAAEEGWQQYREKHHA